MAREISEADWRVFRELHPIALERFCQGVLSEVERLIFQAETSAHERYISLYKLLQLRDNELAVAFDDFRRSTALRQLACIQAHQVLTEDELARFSSETREAIRRFLGL